MTQGEDACDIEKSNIDELRRRMKDLMPSELYEDDNLFERFLKARNHNLAASEDMLINHLRWRKAVRLDTIRTEFKPTPVMVMYDVMSRIAFDKEGSPVIYIAFGNMDIKGGFKSITRSDFKRSLIVHLEEYIAEMKEKSKQLGKPINQLSFIFDYQNLTLTNATYKPAIEFLMSMYSMYETNYPERLKSAYLINGSLLFQICFAMFKPLVTGNTVHKLNIHGTDYQDALLEVIDADQLPAFLGGKRTDPDGNPQCVQSVNFGGVVPINYYLKNRKRKLSEIPDGQTLLVNRMSKVKLELEVPVPGSTLEWRFIVKNKDINFSVLYMANKGVLDRDFEEVIPKEKIETIESSEDGMCICDKTGTYIIEFDNTYSWISSKQIYYSAKVTNPK